ncbi:hypothetical protein CQZ98_20765 [Pseudomonas sp. MYb115]|nr:hypothetical protein CQZ98_20765 [Pseudomonas sp. MYb115]
MLRVWRLRSFCDAVRMRLNGKLGRRKSLGQSLTTLFLRVVMSIENEPGAKGTLKQAMDISIEDETVCI